MKIETMKLTIRSRMYDHLFRISLATDHLINSTYNNEEDFENAWDSTMEMFTMYDENKAMYIALFGTDPGKDDPKLAECQERCSKPLVDLWNHMGRTE